MWTSLLVALGCPMVVLLIRPWGVRLCGVRWVFDGLVRPGPRRRCGSGYCDVVCSLDGSAVSGGYACD